MEDDRIKILNMLEGKSYYFNFSEGGGAEIYKINNLYFLFEVPIYGGLPQYNGKYNITEIDKMIEAYKSWI